jgi:hypothetical protein
VAEAFSNYATASGGPGSAEGDVMKVEEGCVVKTLMNTNDFTTFMMITTFTTSSAQCETLMPQAHRGCERPERCDGAQFCRSIRVLSISRDAECMRSHD